MRILSGVQPSGAPHIGNYFGAIKQHIELQDKPDAEAYYFIADYHAMTTVHDADELRGYIMDVALDYLALGLDPKKAVFFRQSAIPEVLELTWMLGCCTGMGLLERAHSYKDKIARGFKPSVGLFYYPVLMAADILLYKSKRVPVGADQVQHIEMTQDMAEYFNNRYGTDVLVRPEPLLNATARVPGTDGQKMSKSYKNTISLALEGKALKKTVMGIVTDSTPLEDPKDPDTCNVFSLYQLFANEDEQKALAEQYRAGGMGYGDAKKQLLEKIQEYFAPYREKRKELEQNLDHVRDVLKDGAERARAIATVTMDEVRKASGLL